MQSFLATRMGSRRSPMVMIPAPGVREVGSLACHMMCDKNSSLFPGVMVVDSLPCHKMHNKMSSLAPGVMEVHSLACHKACNRKNSSLVPGQMEVGSLACYKVAGSMKTISSVRNESGRTYPCHCSCPWDNVIRHGLFPPVVDAPQLTLMG